MFRHIVRHVEDATLLFRQPSSVLAFLQELAWLRRAQVQQVELGHPFRRSNLSSTPNFWLELLRDQGDFRVPLTFPPNSEFESIGFLWDHLIYAYMVENTGIYEIFRRVLYEFLHGEKLGVPKDAQQWLRTTEELLYRDPPPFHITTITSNIRKNKEEIRRSLYQRMLGMDLNHGLDAKQPFYPYVPYVRAEAANTRFVEIFEEFLREVWIGIQNIKNINGTDPTDRNRIADLTKELQEMLLTRRQEGNLSGEEFTFVCDTSLLHLSVEYNSPIVNALRAEASDPAQRLFKIAERVGVPAHKYARNYFALADPISQILILIETGALNEVSAISALLRRDPPFDRLNTAIESIINHWAVISPRDIKAKRVLPR